MRAAVIFLVVANALAPADLVGQSREMEDPRGVFLALRGGAAFPAGRFRDEVKTAAGFGFEAVIRPHRSLALYAGYANSEHAPSEPWDFPFADLIIGVAGLDAGARLMLPVRRVTPWAGGGIVYKEVRLDVRSTAAGDTSHRWGWEMGGGIGYSLNRRIALTTDVRYRTFEPRQALPVFMDVSWDVPAVNLVLIQAGLAVRVFGWRARN